MKKIVSLVVTTLMLLGTISVNAATINNVPILVRERAGMVYVTDPSAAGSSHSNYRDIGAVGSISQRITVSGSIGTIGMYMPSNSNNIGTVTVTVYKWSSTYANTLRTTPIATRTFVDQPDNKFCTVSIGNNTGDILIHLTGGSDGVGVWVTNSGSVASGVSQTTYQNGAEVSGCLSSAFRLRNASTSAISSRNPYSYTNPGTYNDMSDKVFVESLQDSIDNTSYNAIRFGELDTGSYFTYNSYVSYQGFNFGSTSPKRLSVRVYVTPWSTTFLNDLQFVLDFPDGEIIASARPVYDYNTHKAYYDTHGDSEGYWQEMVCEVTKPVTGVHDLHILNRGSGSYNINKPLALGKFKFIQTEREVTHWEKELKDYVAVPDSALRDSYADTWVATDTIGRKLPDYNDVGAPKNRNVLMFYFISDAAYVGYENDTEFSNNQMVQEMFTGNFNDIKQSYMYPGWKKFGYWNESIYGNYAKSDEWVHRKNLELLAAAGVDAICTDETNLAWAHPTAALSLLRTIHEMRQDGIDAPKFAHILAWGNKDYVMMSLEEIYNTYYGSGLYSDAWYYHDGKPLVMAAKTGSIATTTRNVALDNKHKEIINFFTFRQCEAEYKVGRPNEEMWPWCSIYPQPGFNYQSDTGKYEMMAVSVAQNSNDAVTSYTAMNGNDVYGRSYTNKDRFSKTNEDSVFYGYNYQEQWDYAISKDPENIFITGWNELAAGHQENSLGLNGAYCDQFTDEYSRDAEPTKGQLKDTYYMQTVDNIRRYKGVRQTPVASGAVAIDLSGSFSQWDTVGPEFVGLKGGTEARNHAGRGKYYVNNTGRNDIISSKVSYDANNLYFYVKTAENISGTQSKNWMRLYINADRKYSTGWEGYDFVVNRINPESGEVIVEGNTSTDNNWDWTEVARASYKLLRNELMIAIPRNILGETGDIDIEFKWHDNGVDDGNVLDFYVNGDTAPVGRFNYRYVTSSAVNNSAVSEPIDMNTNLDMLTRKFCVFAVNEPAAYLLGNRTMLNTESASAKTLLVNGETFVPLMSLADAYGAKYTINGSDTVYVHIGDYNARFKVGEKVVSADSEIIKLKTAPRKLNNIIYVPVRAFAKAFNLECVWIEPGVVVIGKNVINTLNINSDLPQRLVERMFVD